MKLTASNAKSITIALLVGLLIISRECNRTKVNAITTVDTVDTVDTIYTVVNNNVYVPEPYETIDSVLITDSVFMYADTLAILTNYFKVRKYSVVLIDDSTAHLVANASVYKNELISMKLEGTVTNKTVTKTIQAPTKNNVYAGLMLGGNKSIFRVGPAISFETKKQHLYTIAYDVVNKQGEVILMYKIGSNKHY